jgi:hypothetical protein
MGLPRHPTHCSLLQAQYNVNDRGGGGGGGGGDGGPLLVLLQQG